MLGYGMDSPNIKLIVIIGDSMKISKLIKFSNKLSNEDLRFLIEINNKRIFVFNPNDKTCYDLNEMAPACINGPQVQINLKE
tara:strand:- start:568 stop:813 length:246 start_codon:yes stop_codon:yes gene_type:complete